MANIPSRSRSFRVAVAACVLVASIASGIAAQTFRFSDFPSLETLSERPASPDESTAPQSWAAVDPVIKDIVRGDIAKGGPNFAGAYYLASVGCGSGCEVIYIIDLRDGKIFKAPGQATNGVLFQRDSRLMIIKEDPFYGLPRKYITFDGALFGELN